MKLLALALLLAALTISGSIYHVPHPVRIKPVPASLPLRLFWGIANTESEFNPLAIGPDGHDRGLWQFRDKYDAERGIVNPFDAIESTRHAVTLFEGNLAALGDIELAITAHRRGRTWARENGVDRGYVERVRAWR